MNIRRSFLATGLTAAIACLPLFGTTGAIVSPMAGMVAVNGHTVTMGSAIASGDTVSTNAAGSARMVMPGGSLIAASNTNFRMWSVDGAPQVRLSRGMVEVSGSLPVALLTRTIVPNSANARFKVYDLSGKVYVEAIAGTVTVKGPSNTYTVHTGEAASFTDAADMAAVSCTGLNPGELVAIVAGVAVVVGIIVHSATECGSGNEVCVVSGSSL